MKVHFLYLHPVQQLADMNAVNCQQGGCCLVSPYITSTENTVWVKDYHTHSNFQYSLETVHGISVGERAHDQHATSQLVHCTSPNCLYLSVHLVSARHLALLKVLNMMCQEQ